MRHEVLRVLEFAQCADGITRLDVLTGAVAEVLSLSELPQSRPTSSSLQVAAFDPGFYLAESGANGLSAMCGWATIDPIRPCECFAIKPGLSPGHKPGPAMLRAKASTSVNACRDYTGCAEGFVVPVRESDGALLSAAFCGPALDLESDARAAFHLAGYYYATRGREILNRIELDPICPLTPRQIECLQWVHAGKTDGEIGNLLGVSGTTVHNHVEAAKRLLNLSKRSQAAFEAWRRGWFA